MVYFTFSDFDLRHFAKTRLNQIYMVGSGVPGTLMGILILEMAFITFGNMGPKQHVHVAAWAKSVSKSSSWPVRQSCTHWILSFSHRHIAKQAAVSIIGLKSMIFFARQAARSILEDDPKHEPSHRALITFHPLKTAHAPQQAAWIIHKPLGSILVPGLFLTHLNKLWSFPSYPIGSLDINLPSIRW